MAAAPAVEKLPAPDLNYSQAKVADFNGDGKSEVAVVDQGRLWVLGEKGNLLVRQRMDNQDPRLAGIGDVTGDGLPEVLVSSRAGKTLHLSWFSGRGEALGSLSLPIGNIYMGKPDSYIQTAAVAPFRVGRKKSLLLIVHSGYGWKPRGVYLVTLDGDIQWQVATGPFAIEPIFADIDGDGDAEVVVGSYSPGNGNVEETTQTDDMHCYLFAIAKTGKALWVKQLGGHFTGIRAKGADLDGDGKDELIAWRSTAYDYREDIGGIFLLDQYGRLSHEWRHPYSITSLALADLDGNGQLEVIAANRRGQIFVLDRELRQTQNVQILEASDAPVYLSVGDMHQSKGLEILAVTYARKPIVTNPRTDVGPRPVIQQEEPTAVLLSNQLSLLARETLMPGGQNLPRFALRKTASAVYIFGAGVWMTPTTGDSVLGAAYKEVYRDENVLIYKLSRQIIDEKESAKALESLLGSLLAHGLGRLVTSITTATIGNVVSFILGVFSEIPLVGNPVQVDIAILGRLNPYTNSVWQNQPFLPLIITTTGDCVPSSRIALSIQRYVGLGKYETLSQTVYLPAEQTRRLQKKRVITGGETFLAVPQQPIQLSRPGIYRLLAESLCYETGSTLLKVLRIP